jgi:hypothetical protein
MRVRAIVVACRLSERGADGCVHVRSYEKGHVRAARLNTLRKRTQKRKHSQMYVKQVTSSRRSAPIEILADLVTQHDESSSFPFHIQRLNLSQASLAPPNRFWIKEQPGMAKKRKTSSLDTHASNLATASPITSQRDYRLR